jgi:hypothetical protein
MKKRIVETIIFLIGFIGGSAILHYILNYGRI